MSPGGKKRTLDGNECALSRKSELCASNLLGYLRPCGVSEVYGAHNQGGGWPQVRGPFQFELAGWDHDL